MRIQALDKYDNVEEGTVYECPDSQASKLIAKGLAKAAEPHSNKMAPQSENKADPSADDGQGQPSSASQAAPASAEPTVHPYPGGGLVTPDPAIAEQERQEHEQASAEPTAQPRARQGRRAG